MKPCYRNITNMSLSEVKRRISAIENNQSHEGASLGIREYRTSVGFFSFNDDQKSDFIDACFCSSLLNKFTVNTTNASLVYTSDLQYFYKMNIIVCNNVDAHAFQNCKNIVFISDNSALVDFIQFAKFRICNPIEDMNAPLTMVLSVELFLIFNSFCTTKSIYVSRVVFVNTHETRPFQHNLKLRASFTWIENRYNKFQGGFLTQTFHDVIYVKGLYACITADYYEPFYDEDQVTYFKMNTSRIRSISSRDYLQNKLVSLSGERKKMITDIVLKKQETECSICLERLGAHQLLGLTSCCQYTVCSQCADDMVSTDHAYQCFACRKPKLYLDFVKPYMSFAFSLKDVIPGFDETKRYLVVTAQNYQKYLYKETNITVTRYPLKIKKLDFQGVIFLSNYSFFFKEKLCSAIKNKDLKVYEIQN